MNPVYQPQLAGPQPWDVQQALAHYPLAPAPAPGEVAAVPTLTVDRQLAIACTFAEAGDSILALALGTAAPMGSRFGSRCPGNTRSRSQWPQDKGFGRLKAKG